MTDRYSYDAYGALLSHDWYAGSVDQPYQYVGELGYYTHYQEPTFGLLQLGVRFYEPEVAAFSQRDPMRRSWDAPYCYAYGRLLSLVDPLGLLNIGSDLDFDWNTGEAKCHCKLDVLGQESLSRRQWIVR